MTATFSTETRANRLITICSIGVMCFLAPIWSSRAATYTVVNANDSGTGSLRWGITQANGNPGTDTIAFSITGAGPHTIQPSSPLPAITDSVIIDGYTQPGSSTATATSPATLMIEVDGSLGGSGANGLTIDAGGTTVRGLAINRFDSEGIELTASGCVVQGNHLGTDISGSIALGNDDGVEISYASNNTIGGAAYAARNVISGNNDDGIDIEGSSAWGNLVQGNYIGTTATGAAALGNDGYGVEIDGAPGNTIGGTTAGARNILSDNGNDGVGMWGSTATGNVVVGNYIGTDISGTVTLGNAWEGVYIENASGNTIGGADPEARNIISGNGFISGSGGGVVFYGGGATGNKVLGNYIGTDVTGTLGMGNCSDGVGMYGGASNNTIGGTTQGAGNIISCNEDDGIDVGGTGNVLQGNYIGTNPACTALGNTEDGVWLDDAYNTLVGGTAAGAPNVIAYNGLRGVKVRYTGNAILSNSIFANGSLGIDLLPEGGTPNDPGDGDTGANNLQNFPVLESVTMAGNNTVIEGALNSTPSDTFRIEFFFNTDTDASGYGEGESFLGSTQVVTDGNGDAAFLVSLPTPVRGAPGITATATDANNNTSEFSGALVYPLILSCELVGGDVVLDWTVIPGTANYWVYGKTNHPWFVPDLTASYANRVAVVPGGTTTWSSPAGVGDIDDTWIYLAVAMDATDQEIVRSNRCGEIDYEAENIPPQ